MTPLRLEDFFFRLFAFQEQPFGAPDAIRAGEIQKFVERCAGSGSDHVDR